MHISTAFTKICILAKISKNVELQAFATDQLKRKDLYSKIRRLCKGHNLRSCSAITNQFEVHLTMTRRRLIPYQNTEQNPKEMLMLRFLCYHADTI
ncbi:unnamed protein product [Cylicocyclus nassatus]|uniref:Uncharacterized protein n=1 Tax=Cylicocyclus nassatus TaxID=53992 RepID=A0AA36H278_CYLNA|nr:unnamed protein product [Cylicocyclus nassatus]